MPIKKKQTTNHQKRDRRGKISIFL